MLPIKALITELHFKAIRSSGSGGQHVNKVSSKVELQFNLMQSQVLSQVQKERLQTQLASKLTKTGVLILQCDDTRSQFQNKTRVIQRFLKLIEDALKVKRKRIPTKIPKAVVKKRLDNKRRQSEKKSNRRKPDNY